MGIRRLPAGLRRRPLGERSLGHYSHPFACTTGRPLRGGNMDSDESQDAQKGLLMQVSNEMVRLYKTQFGRGPTKVRSDWAGPDALITTLEDSLTPAERNMVVLGEHHRLRDTRMFFQYAFEKE